MELNFNESMNAMFDKVEEFFRSKTVVGESITIGDTTIIPVMDISLGIGLGGGDGVDDKANKGNGGGGGVGAKGTPTAVIVLKGDSVEVLPVRRQAGLEKLLEMVPDMVDRIRQEKKDGDAPEESGE